MHRQQIKRLLEKMGFAHVAGWVRREDAPQIIDAIEEAAPAVEEIKRQAKNKEMP